MTKILLILLLPIIAQTSRATDLTLLGGLQFNTDFEVITLNGQPPEASPRSVGQPCDDVEQRKESILASL